MPLGALESAKVGQDNFIVWALFACAFHELVCIQFVTPLSSLCVS